MCIYLYIYNIYICSKRLKQRLFQIILQRNLVEVEDQVQLADVAEVTIQAFHKVVHLASTP